MARLYLVAGAAEIQRRRALLPAGQFAEAWPTVDGDGHFWVGEESKAVLDAAGAPMPSVLSVDGAHVPVYYGPRLVDWDALPREESLQARVLSAGGVGAAWVPPGHADRQPTSIAASPSDPVFFLRRPRAEVAHVWRLFRSRDDAIAYMRERGSDDPEALAWAQALPAATFEELVARYGRDA